MSDETPAQRTPDCPSCDAPGFGRWACPRCGWTKADKPPAPLVRPKDYGSLLDRVRPRGPRRPASGYVSPLDCDWPANGEWGDGL